MVLVSVQDQVTNEYIFFSLAKVIMCYPVKWKPTICTEPGTLQTTTCWLAQMMSNDGFLLRIKLVLSVLCFVKLN